METEEKRCIETRIGKYAIDDTAIISFPQGMLGIAEKTKYIILDMVEQSPFRLLQSIEDKEFALLVTNPYNFMEKYPVVVDKNARKLLQLKKGEPFDVLVTVTIPQNEPEKLSLNLTGPIIVNTREQLALQVPQYERESERSFFPFEGVTILSTQDSTVSADNAIQDRA